MPKGEAQGMRIGYARVSTRDQNLEMQLDALNKAGCKRICVDKLSGVQVERPGLKEALSHLREADTPRGLETGSPRAQRERIGGPG
jgi:predicted site-specific integrase-resolvase